VSGRRLRVLVVEDSATVRARLCETIERDPDLVLAGQGANGKDAIELCLALRPDVITMDMILPIMSGLSATEYIMAHCPTPILIVSASTNRGELFKTYDALSAGAVDVLDKPGAAESDESWERRFVSAVKLVAKIKVITHLRGRLGAASLPPAAPGPARAFDERVLAVGASTGGPAAVVALLRRIPTGLETPILLVLHIDEPFGTAFADWLDCQTPHRVAYAIEGQRLADVADRVAMAPPGRHLVVAGGRLHLTTSPPRHSCRPSVDELFFSVATACGPRGIGCLLTGMGKDGAAGLLEMRRAGAHTLAQDEASSVVYGMPREAAQLGAAERVLPLDQLGPAIAQHLAAHPQEPT
jgi:two-component system chemotaxis response regulator CheB